MKQIRKTYKYHVCRNILCTLLLFSVSFPFSKAVCQTEAGNESRKVVKDFYNGTVLRIDVLKENLVRIRMVPKGMEFKETGLNRYGFIQTVDAKNLNPVLSDSKTGFTVSTAQLTIKGNVKTGEMIIMDSPAQKILVHQIAAVFAGDSAKAVFKAAKNEDWIGFGDQSRDRLYHRGFTADCWVRNVKSYIPVPFFMSTLGIGLMVNTSNKVVFDLCKSNPGNYSWTDGKNVIDYYVMKGEGFRELLGLYTDLTGKPKLPPEWSFGLWYICRTQANDYEALNDALNFRREEIPCDVIGLEPGWMEKNYDFSTQKSWSKQRFPIPFYAFNGPHNFINAIKRMGFKLELWLCNDYDLTNEEERRLEKGKSDARAEKTPGVSSEIVEVDEHLTRSVPSDQKPGDRDTISRADEPWFKHLEKFVGQGVDFFKQDGASQVLDHPKREWGNGMADAEVHNLYPLFYSRQMYEGFASLTNRRPVVFTPCGWIGFQAWSGTWTGDTGGRLATLGAMLNTSVVGHSWATNDMEVTEKEGIHFGYLQPWSQINSWNYFRMPWVQGTALTAMHKYYAQLRSRLIPYLYSWAYDATQTGWPMLVPLTMEYPDDIDCRNNLHQYLLGRDLMVGIYEKNIYFPAGEWKDYWTGKVVKGLQQLQVDWPADRGGALYVRSGAIIPFGPLMQYRGEKAVNEITLYIFPSEKQSSFELYEDDGISFDHLNGKFSITPLLSKIENGNASVEIGKSAGSFTGKVETRIWNIIMHADTAPSSVLCNNQPLPEEDYSWDNNRKELTIKGVSAPATIKILK